MRGFLFFSLAAIVSGMQLHGVESVKCTSPDGLNVISFQLVEGAPQYGVSYAGKEVIRDSALGLNLEKQPFGSFEIASIKTDAQDSTWKPVVGELETVRDHYHRLTVTLRAGQFHLGNTYSTQ
jgi:glucan 1,4-alpha-glucosidase